uniref:Uncharacterized protein n=1 Tax=Branchiostoma floridae TaxID=7739 RepID=C3ZFQ2_BRAFL|eukprot:XP_002592649.1 hypothetical protein BRAFLDRAFT_85124 [Branchiostoma floridae]
MEDPCHALEAMTGTVRDYSFTIYITKRKRPAVIPSLPASLMKPIIQTLQQKPASLLALFLVGMLLCDAFPQRGNGPPVNATVGLPAPRTGTSVLAKLEEPSRTKNGTATRSRRNSSRENVNSYPESGWRFTIQLRGIQSLESRWDGRENCTLDHLVFLFKPTYQTVSDMSAVAAGTR